MSISSAPGALIYPAVDWGTSGATLGVRIRRKTDGVDVVARVTVGVSESPALSGIYVKTTGLTAPSTGGAIYEVVWDDTVNYASEDLTVSYSAAAASVPLATDLCTVADVESAMEATSTPASVATLIQTFITAASSLIENQYQRNFAPRSAQTYTFKVIGFSVDLAPHDLRTATTVTLDPQGTATVLAATQYRLSPSGAESNLGTYTNVQLSRLQNLYSSSVTNFGYTELGILGDWGPATIPPDVQRACALTVASWLSARLNNQTSNLLGDLAEDGRDLRPDRFGGFAIPFDAHMIFRQYERPAASFA